MKLRADIFKGMHFLTFILAIINVKWKMKKPFPICDEACVNFQEFIPFCITKEF